MRSFLLEPVDRSRVKTWLLVTATVAVSVIVVFSVREALGNGTPRRGAAASTLAAAQLRLAESSRPGVRVLFIGNSFTAANSLPNMVRRLAAPSSGSRPVFPVAYDPSGSQLHQAVVDPELLQLLRGVRWNVVVVQEQSQLPALPYWLHASTLPAVRQLVAMIRSRGGEPVLFETWGYEQGDPMNITWDSYRAMQTRLHAGYFYLSHKEDVPVAAVGDAWAQALRQRPAAPMWSGDGKHPSLEGSYLAAVVIAAAVLQQSSPGHKAITVNRGYTAGLASATAAWLQRVGLTTAREPSPALDAK